jgi:sugar/nucleoside kinase (ribokinase family)
MRLYYPTSDPDERVLSVTHIAGAFTPDQVANLRARVFLINASTRGEVDEDVIRALKQTSARIAADAQGFVRIIAPDGTLTYDDWPAKRDVLSHIDILKVDAVEALALTGQADMREAARTLAGWGPEEIVLTHRDGVLVLVEGRFHEARFCPQTLVGRSGRGDTCIAAYVGKRFTASPEEATVWAAAVTSLKMEAEGPITRRLQDVEDLVQRMKERLFECAPSPGLP